MAAEGCNVILHVSSLRKMLYVLDLYENPMAMMSLVRCRHPSWTRFVLLASNGLEGGLMESGIPYLGMSFADRYSGPR